mmetsp:Transcript_10068/g.12668  ORF Transcript_10068/g.12668 Transcript_10068/m.12668 type:complete len:81 (-) Transcript_10068:3993-4235(-)
MLYYLSLNKISKGSLVCSLALISQLSQHRSEHLEFGLHVRIDILHLSPDRLDFTLDQLLQVAVLNIVAPGEVIQGLLQLI